MDGRMTILVVGEGPYKASTASVLKRYGYTVEETKDISRSQDARDQSTFLAARRWISKNSLQRFDGQSVKILCAMDMNGTVRGRYDLKWVDLINLIFQADDSPVGSPVGAVLQHRDTLSQMEALKRRFFKPENSVVLETMDDHCVEDLRMIIKNLVPFRVRIESGFTHELKPWSSEKVILFGRTGSGKSTIAQMLTLGHLDSEGHTFRASSSARGVTGSVERGEGRGWHVTDTPGFGEAKAGTVSTEEATQMLKKFVVQSCGIYSHYLYVVKKDRMSKYDENLWKFFKTVFRNADQNFSVVVTCCETKLTNENMKHLQTTFEGCKNFHPVDFCKISPDPDDPDLETENTEEREKSLKNLERDLAELGRVDRECFTGMFSKEAVRAKKSEVRYTQLGHISGSAGDFVVEGLRLLYFKPVAKMNAYFRRSEVDEHFILLPQ